MNSLLTSVQREGLHVGWTLGFAVKLADGPSPVPIASIQENPPAPPEKATTPVTCELTACQLEVLPPGGMELALAHDLPSKAVMAYHH